MPTMRQPGTSADVNQCQPSKMFPCGPIKYQTVTCRVTSCCQTKSGCPSPLKSLTPTTRHSGTSLGASQFQPKSVVPSSPPMYQTVTRRDVSCCHTRSGRPSPLKSPVATMRQPEIPVEESQSHLSSVLPCWPPKYQTVA